MSPLLEIKNLTIQFPGRKLPAVKDLNLQLQASQSLGLVGESGSGKSVMGLSILGLLPEGAQVSGEIVFQGQNLLEVDAEGWTARRGSQIAMIFQEPMTCLNPVMPVIDQISEILRLQGLDAASAKTRSAQLLDEVGVRLGVRMDRAYPHELSGGQRQRVMIAMAIACKPALLIADEPTTALDGAVQTQILDLLKSLQKKYNMGLLFITHDLNLVKEWTDTVCVMSQGQIVESATTASIFENPRHEYTRALLENLKPQFHRVESTFASSEVLFELKNVGKKFAIRSPVLRTTVGEVTALEGVNLKLLRGRTLGVVGPSGSGKSTLGRLLVKLLEPSEGQITYAGQDIGKLNGLDLKKWRRKVQIVFQDPYSSLNPRHTIEKALFEPMVVHGIGSSQAEREQFALHLLGKVGLEPSSLHRLPHEFSGGQRQRICIARALSVQPEFIVCDEAVSALDAAVRGQIMKLLSKLKEEFNLTYVFISHDMETVRAFSDEILVLNQGQVL